MSAQLVRPAEAYISVSGAIRCKELSQSLPLPPKEKGVTGLGDLFMRFCCFWLLRFFCGLSDPPPPRNIHQLCGNSNMTWEH